MGYAIERTREEAEARAARKTAELSESERKGGGRFEAVPEGSGWTITYRNRALDRAYKPFPRWRRPVSRMIRGVGMVSIVWAGLTGLLVTPGGLTVAYGFALVGGGVLFYIGTWIGRLD